MKTLTACLLLLVSPAVFPQWTKLQQAKQFPALLFPLEINDKTVLATIDSSSNENFMPKSILKSMGIDGKHRVSVKFPGVVKSDLKFTESEILDEFVVLGGATLHGIRMIWDISRERIRFEESQKGTTDGIPFEGDRFRFGDELYRLPVLSSWTLVPEQYSKPERKNLKSFLGSGRDFKQFSVIVNSNGIQVVQESPFGSSAISAGSTFGNQTIVIDYGQRRIIFDKNSEHRLSNFLTQITGVVFEFESRSLFIKGHQVEHENEAMTRQGVIGAKVLELGGISLHDRQISDSELIKELLGKRYCVILVNSKRIRVNLTIE